MLASMSEIDPRAETPLVDWSELSVSGLLPTGTVTLLLADVEGSTRLWETQPDEMTTAIARLNQTVSEIIAEHDGVRPVEQGEGDSFVAAFARAIGRGGRGAGDATRSTGPDPVANRGAHRRNPAARRRQLRRPDDQPHRAAARSRPRRPDADVGHHGGLGARPAAFRRLVDRSGHPCPA